MNFILSLASFFKDTHTHNTHHRTVPSSHHTVLCFKFYLDVSFSMVALSYLFSENISQWKMVYFFDICPPSLN